MKSFEPIVTEKRAVPNKFRAARAPMLPIISCLVFANYLAVRPG